MNVGVSDSAGCDDVGARAQRARSGACAGDATPAPMRLTPDESTSTAVAPPSIAGCAPAATGGSPTKHARERSNARVVRCSSLEFCLPARSIADPQLFEAELMLDT